MGPPGPPEPLAARHDVTQFSSGVPTLDAWLRGKARLNEAKGGARTYVACDGDRVAGFYSLASSSLERRRVSSRVDRDMPDPVPVILLGQLAVDENYRHRRLGSDLLVDAAGRCLAAAGVAGARAIVVQATRARPRGSSRGFRPGRERSATARTVSPGSRTTRLRTVAAAGSRAGANASTPAGATTYISTAISCSQPPSASNATEPPLGPAHKRGGRA